MSDTTTAINSYNKFFNSIIIIDLIDTPNQQHIAQFLAANSVINVIGVIPHGKTIDRRKLLLMGFVVVDSKCNEIVLKGALLAHKTRLN